MKDSNWSLGAIHSGEIHKQREQKLQRESWAVYHSGIKSYDDLFLKVLPEGSFLNIVRPGSSILDSFAPTSFIRELNQKGAVSGGIAITLSDTRSVEERQIDAFHGIAQVEANFYTCEWLYPVNEDLQKRAKMGFDLITCAPIGGWLDSDINGFCHAPNEEQIWWTTDTLWRLLDVDGNLFISYATKHHDELLRWIGKLNSLGIRVSLGSNSQIARFTKDQDSLHSLPEF